MPLTLKEGELTPIPCRHCGRAAGPWRLAAGAHSLRCRSCGGETEIRAERVGGAWEIRTAGLPRPKPPPR